MHIIRTFYTYWNAWEFTFLKYIVWNPFPQILPLAEKFRIFGNIYSTHIWVKITLWQRWQRERLLKDMFPACSASLKHSNRFCFLSRSRWRRCPRLPSEIINSSPSSLDKWVSFWTQMKFKRRVWVHQASPSVRYTIYTEETYLLRQMYKSKINEWIVPRMSESSESIHSLSVLQLFNREYNHNYHKNVSGK